MSRPVPRALIRYLEQTPEGGLVSHRVPDAQAPQEPSPEEVPDRVTLAQDIASDFRRAQLRDYGVRRAADLTPEIEIHCLVLAIHRGLTREAMRAGSRVSIEAAMQYRREQRARYN